MNRQSRRRRAALLSATAAALALAGAAQALPTGGVVYDGTSPGGATFSSTPTTLSVNQTAQRVVIDWTGFNIANGETVTFTQPNASAIAFNRISSLSPTTIDGALNANGAVFLFSPSGMIFGPSATVNVGSFVTSMGSLANADVTDALSYNYAVFQLIPTGPSQPAPPLTVQSGAQIHANAGFVQLIGPSITQDGTVTASDSVTYFVTEGGGLNYTPTAAGLVYDSGRFYWVAGRGRLAFTHNGSTTAGKNFRLVAPSANLEPGYHSILNLSGTVQAGALGPSSNGFVLFATGSDGTPVNDSTISIDASTAQISAPGDVQFEATDITFGAMTIGGDFHGTVARNLTFAGPLVTGGLIDARSHSSAVAGSFNINKNITAAGYVDLENKGGAITVAPSVTFSAAGLALTAAGPVSIGDNAHLTSSGELSIEAQGLVTIGTGALVETTGGVEFFSQTWPILFTPGDDNHGGVGINAEDIDLRGTITSRYSSGPGDVALIIGVNTASAVIGGPGGSGGPLGPPGWELSNAEFQRINARTILIGSATNDGGQGADIEVKDLTLDSSHLSRLLVGTENHDITVSGTVTGAGPGLVDVDFGSIGLFYASNEDAFFAIPNDILISGGLGTSDHPLGRVRMIAMHDILMGSSDFVGTVADDPGFSPQAGNSLALPAPGHLFVSASELQMATLGRIIQQNSGTGFEDAGILVGAPSAQDTLIVTPDLLALAAQLGAPYGFVVDPEAEAPIFAQGPTLIDLHLAIRSAPGQADVTGFAAATTTGLLPAGLAARPEYLINDCVFGGGGCTASEETPHYDTPVELGDDSTPLADEVLALDPMEADGKPLSMDSEELVMSFVALPNDDEEDEKDKLSLPVTGTGNGDLWRPSPEGATP